MNAQALTPTVHLNGTSVRTLMDGWTNLEDALGGALGAVEKLEFNPRDYYPKGDAGFAAARDELQRGVAALREFHEAAGEVVMALHAIEADREARKAAR